MRIDIVSLQPITVPKEREKCWHNRHVYDHGHDYGKIDQNPPNQDGGAWKTRTILRPVGCG